MRKFFLLILLLGIMVSAGAQNFHYKYYTEIDGLSNKSVVSIIADEEGFLWLGTKSGLNRFDGNAFEKFYNNPADNSSIADNNIQKLFIDARKRLWIGTNAGISLYNRRTNNFSNFTPDTNVLPRQGISFGAICDAPDNRVWVGTKNELLVFDPETKRFSSSGWAKYAAGVVPANSNHQRVIVLSLVKKSHDELWVLSTYGLFSVNTLTLKFQYYPYLEQTDFYSLRLNYADEEGNVWMNTFNNGILCFNSKQNTWADYSVPLAAPGTFLSNNLIHFSGDTLAHAQGTKIIFFDGRQKKLLQSTISDPDTINTRLYANADGQTMFLYQNYIWLGTSMGLVKITPFNSPFHFYPLTTGGEVYRVFKLSGSNDFLYTAIHSTYGTYIKTGNSTRPVNDPANNLIQVQYQYMTEGKDGNLFLNDDEHFYRYNKNTNTTINIPVVRNPGTDSTLTMRNMVFDREGTLWVRSVDQGILKYDTLTRQLVPEKNIPHHPDIEIGTMYYDSLTHCIWYSEEFSGINVYDISTHHISHYDLDKNRSQHKAAIIYMSGDGKGNVWLSDLQAGLIEYNYKEKKFIRYNTSDGLLSDNCWWTILDKQGILWINTDKGLCKYNPVTKKFLSFKEAEGFPFSSQQFLSKDEWGNIYMPFKNGYYTWNGKDIPDVVNKGTIYLKDAQLFDLHLQTDTTFSFSYTENNIRLLFGLLSFDSRDAVVFEYSLNGNSWVTTDDHSYISFANLAPGKYHLTVRLKNEDIAPLNINFVIAKPFWLQWWFLLLMVALIAAILFYIGRERFQRVRQRSLLQQKLMESEMSALRSQMNPHFIFNTLNSINSYIIENKRDEASDYLTDFSRLMRIILEHSQKKTVALSDELNALKLYLELESKRLEAAFDYRFTISNDVDVTAIPVPPLIIQPFAENAIWHGLRGKKSVGHLEIMVNTYNEGTLIVVQDDGIGRHAAEQVEKVKESNSFGTAATMQRIILYHPKSKVEIEDLHDSAGNAAGTRVNIYLYHNLK